MGWIENADAVEGIEVDVGFVISSSFYFGPEEGYTPRQREALREPIYAPRIPLPGRYALNKAVAGSERELVEYYRDVLRLYGEHRRPVNRRDSYFWPRPLIYKPGEFAIEVLREEIGEDYWSHA